ncbi:MAG: glycosyltransferase family 39 protein [Candidatus Rokubacteria bacterium]|nr:glycosyltransferase family 39 protein [Candidatus Rokubacteria bacterium]
MTGRGTGAAVGLAVLLAAPLLAIGLGRAPPDDPGEGMHAEIARELTVSRDPFALTLNGIAYVDKPPLLYALMAGALSLAGTSEAAARAVPALGALGAVAATAWLGARLLGGRGGFVAGAALLTSAGFFAYGRYVRPETLFVAALALGFAWALVGLRDGRRGMVVAGLAAFGAAGLAKDPLGALGPPLAIGVALGLGGRVRPVERWLPLAGVVACVALAFGWWVLAEIRTPGFAWYTIADNHVLNVLRARRFPDEDVPLSAVQFLAVAGAGALPWVIPAAASAVDLVRLRAWRDREGIAWVALLVWTVGVLGLTALSPFRLPHYGLPAYPAIALLAARAWVTGRVRPLLVAHAVGFAVVAGACALAWTSDGSVFMTRVMTAADVAARKSAAAGQEMPLPQWESFRALLGATAATAGIGALVTGALAGGGGHRFHGLRRGLAVLVVVATMLGTLPSVAAALALVATHRSVRSLALELRAAAASGDLVAHEGPIENSGALEWYSGRRPVIVDGRKSVLGFGATRPEARESVWEAADLRRAWESGRRVWVVTTRGPEMSLVPRLPGARLVAASEGRWLWVNR